METKKITAAALALSLSFAGLTQAMTESETREAGDRESAVVVSAGHDAGCNGECNGECSGGGVAGCNGECNGECSGGGGDDGGGDGA